MKMKRVFLVLMAMMLSVGSLACKSKDAGVSSGLNTNGDNANSQMGAQPGGISGAKVSSGKLFRGSISDKKIQMTLQRDGEQLSGTYSYQKIGSDLSLKGTIDKQGNFKLKESDNSGAQTGEFEGKWNEQANLPTATLDGTWSKPNSSDKLSFYATEQMIEFTSGLRVVTREIEEEDKKKKYTMFAEYPELVGASNPNAEKFNREIKNWVMKQTGDFKKEMMEMSEEDMDPDTQSGDLIEIGYDVTYATEDLISIIFGVSTYSRGAAHPNYSTYPVNFDLKSGARLKLSDLFQPGSDYLSRISSYSIEDLKRQAGKDNYGYEQIEEGAAPEDDNYQSWNISKKGLAITFDAYQVASYAEGPKNVVVPYASLRDAVRSDGALSAVLNRK